MKEVVASVCAVAYIVVSVVAASVLVREGIRRRMEWWAVLLCCVAMVFCPRAAIFALRDGSAYVFSCVALLVGCWVHIGRRRRIGLVRSLGLGLACVALLVMAIWVLLTPPAPIGLPTPAPHTVITDGSEVVCARVLGQERWPYLTWGYSSYVEFEPLVVLKKTGRNITLVHGRNTRGVAKLPRHYERRRPVQVGDYVLVLTPRIWTSGDTEDLYGWDIVAGYPTSDGVSDILRMFVRGEYAPTRPTTREGLDGESSR